MLTLQELRSSTHKELLHELATARKDCFRLRMNVRTKNQKDTSLLKKQRRYVARLGTLLKEIDLEEMVKKATKID